MRCEGVYTKQNREQEERREEIELRAGPRKGSTRRNGSEGKGSEVDPSSPSGTSWSETIARTHLAPRGSQCGNGITSRDSSVLLVL